MPELKKIRVREAKARDVGLFKKLWMGLLEKQAKNGSLAVPSEQTLSLYVNLFNAYTEGNFEGIVLLVADKGVLMWGDPATPVEYPGRTLMGWGCFADGEGAQSIEDALYERAWEWASEKDFEGVIRPVYPMEEPPEGFKPVGLVLYRAVDG